MKRIIKAFATLGLLAGVAGAQACTLGNWTSTSGAISSGGPEDPNVLARYSGLCAAESTGGSILDNSPGDEVAQISRFYFFAAGSGTSTVIFDAFNGDDGTGTSVFNAAYDGTNVTVSATGGTGTVVVAAAANRWNSVEIAYNGDGTVDAWVNSDSITNPTPDGTITAVPSDVIASVRLGPDGSTNGFTSFNFDSYVSRRSSAIGTLVDGDGNNDGNVNSGDIIVTINEFLNPTASAATGQPDCNRDGNVNSGDVICVINTFLAP